MVQIDNDVKLDYSDVMLVPQLGWNNAPQSRADVSLLNSDGVCPIIAANMDGVGTFEVALELSKFNMLTALHKHYNWMNYVKFYNNNPNVHNHYIYSMGANEDDYAKFEKVFHDAVGLNIVCVDVANGYTDDTAKFIKRIRDFYGIKVIAGNVVTAEGVHHLACAGADIIKIGIGPGSVCTTRKMTGVGYPQFSAVLECVAAAKVASVKIIADGGITCPGDIAKAFAVGADYVMLGGMLAGHDEGGGENVYPTPCTFENCRPTHKKFYGMASKTAQEKHNGGVSEYRASEGKEVLVPYRGPVKNTIQEILGGLRSSCALQGKKHLYDLSYHPKFVKVHHQLNNVFGG